MIFGRMSLTTMTIGRMTRTNMALRILALITMTASKMTYRTMAFRIMSFGSLNQ